NQLSRAFSGCPRVDDVRPTAVRKAESPPKRCSVAHGVKRAVGEKASGPARPARNGDSATDAQLFELVCEVRNVYGAIAAEVVVVNDEQVHLTSRTGSAELAGSRACHARALRLCR